MTFMNGNLAVSGESMKRAMQKVKKLTPRGTYLTLEQTMKEIHQWSMGWPGYYLMTQYATQFAKIEVHPRKPLCFRMIDQLKKRRHFYRKLVKRIVS